MSTILVGNAPCSWGSLEFENIGEPVALPQMLDELEATGYTGTELGDWGYMPTEPGALAYELSQRRLTLTGAFVPVALAQRAAHAPGVERAVRTARLLAAAADLLGSRVRPFLVLADDNGTVPARTQNAGRVTPALGLSAAHWRIFCDGAQAVARAVRDQTGLRTVFHHHCAGYVETAEEITRFLDMTDPGLIGLVFDTGHYAYATGGCEHVLPALDAFAGRIWYVHFKDCHPGVLAQARAAGWDYFAALRAGVFCELGQGCVDFPGVVQWLQNRNYSGYVTVEQDILPGMGTPRESAARNRAYLAAIGL